MEAQDLFADEMQIGRPAVFALDCAHVGRERVEPDVKHVARIGFDRYAPFDARAGDRNIRKTAAYESQDLVTPDLRPDEVRVGVVELEQPVSEGREFEEVVLFR